MGHRNAAFFILFFLCCEILGASEPLRFQKKQIELGGQVLTVEVADNFPLRQQGLMGRKALPEGTGMLFVFDHEEQLSFWMKNTLVPLSIGFFDKEMRLVDVQEMTPPESVLQRDQTLTVYRSRKPAKFALELPKKWFEKYNVKPPAVFKFVDASKKK